MPASLYQPSNDPLHQLAVAHDDVYRWLTYSLWGLAILLSIGDILTTWIGVTSVFGPPHDQLIESVPFTQWVLTMFGPWALVPMKSLILGLIAILSYLFLPPYRLIFPLIATACNAFAVCNNIDLLVRYSLIELPV